MDAVLGICLPYLSRLDTLFPSQLIGLVERTTSMSRRRPGAVTAASVMAIIYGSLFTLCGVCGIVGMAAQSDMGDNPFFAGQDPAQAKVMKEVQAAIAADLPAGESIQIVAALVGLCESVALLVAGIGLLGMRHWARTLALTVAIIAIVTTVLQSIYQVAVVMPATSRALQAVLPAAAPQPGPQGAQFAQGVRFVMQIGSIISIVIYVLVILYLLVIIILLLQRHVRPALAGWDRAAFEEGQGGNDYREQDYGDDEWRRPRRVEE